MNITIFGGSLPTEEDKAYQDAFTLGAILASRGHTIITGGYIGTMEAASKGAYLEGGKVIGLTCDEIEKWRPVAPNRFITEEIRSITLMERLIKLIEMGDILIALPGGIGTLAEITTAWSQLQVNSINPKPLILIGNEWKDTFDCIFTNLNKYIHEKDKALLAFAADINIALDLVDTIK